MSPEKENYITEIDGELISNVNLSKKDLSTINILYEELIKKLKKYVKKEYTNLNFERIPLNDASHHMGGISMDESLLNKNLELEGASGIFVCSSSVLKNSGSANPTLTITALGLRLGEYLSK